MADALSRPDPADRRRRAEERLRSQLADPLEPLSEVETRRLVRELCVRQIELEIHNEELRDARAHREEALVSSEGRFRALVENGPEGVALVDAAGRIVYTSPALNRLLGFSADELLGTPALDLCHPEELDVLGQVIGPLLRSPGAQATGQHRVRHRDGSWVWVETSVANHLDDPRLQTLVVYLHDLTARKRTEEALFLSESHLAGIIGSAMDGIITLDEQQRIVLFNATAEHLFGRTRDEVLGRSVEILMPERFRARHHGHVQTFASTGITTRKMGGTSPVIGLRSSGEEFPLEASISQIEVMGRKLYTAIVRDISERIRGETQIREYADRLRVLSQQLLQAQETERRHLARELHDEIGQVLSAVSITLKTVHAKVDPAVRSRLVESIAIVDRAIQQVRDLSLDLRPPMLDDFGLEAALRWYAARFAERAGLPVHFTAQTSLVDFPESVRNGCFRLAQEAMTNVLRHGQARQVWIDLRQDQELTLTNRDDGRGFDVSLARQRAARGESLGLISMQERVALLRGKLDVESRPGAGTTIRVRVPVPAVEEEVEDSPP